MELHAVHINVDDDTDIVVISSMYQLTTNESLVHDFLKTIVSTLPAEPANATQSTWAAHWTSTGFNAAGEAFADDAIFYKYRGSLTTPPCAPVTFIISPYLYYTTATELAFMRGQMVEANARPIQAPQGRTATKYSTNVIKYSSSSSTGLNGAPSARIPFSVPILVVAAMMMTFISSLL
jgi:carbonic anhydrase